MDRLPFLAKEKVEFVLTGFEKRPVIFSEVEEGHRSAYAVPVIVITKKGSHRCKETTGVHRIVSQKFKHGTVKLVCSAFGNYVYLRTGIASVLRGEVRSLKLNFLNEVDSHVVDLTRVATRV